MALCIVVRRGRLSLGLPIAYLGLLQLNHLPGAIAHVFADEQITFGITTPTEYTNTGMFLTTIGAICFVIGVATAGWRRVPSAPHFHQLSSEFAKFCLY